MNKKFSRVVSLFLSIIMCFSCVAFADGQDVDCKHIKGEFVLELNSENISKALLDLAGNKEEDIEKFFYDGPLDFYYQEEELYKDSENGIVDLLTKELLSNKYVQDGLKYYVEDLSDKEIYEELKEEMYSELEDFYMGYPYAYESIKGLEYKSMKVVYDIYTYLPDKLNTEIKMTIYILSDDINNNIVIPIEVVIDENALLVNSEIVLTMYDIVSKLQKESGISNDFTSIEYRNLLAEQLIDIEYLEIKFDTSDIEDFSIIKDNRDSFEKFSKEVLSLFNDFNVDKCITNNNEIVITSENIEKFFEDLLIYTYKNYDNIFDGIYNGIIELYVDVIMTTPEAEGYSKEEVVKMTEEMFKLEDEDKVEFDFDIKCKIFMLLNALNNSSENEYMLKDLEPLFVKVKEYENALYDKHNDTERIPCYSSVDCINCEEVGICEDCQISMDCMPYYRYNYNNVEEYLFEEVFEEEMFEVFALLNILKDKTRASNYNSNYNVDLLTETLNCVEEFNLVYGDYKLLNTSNKYSIDNKENKVITIQVDKKCDIEKVDYMIDTVENIMCPITTSEIMYDNYDEEWYNWCFVESTHFDNSTTTDYSVDYKLVNGSFYINADYIEACYNLRLTEKESDGVKYFVSVLYDNGLEQEVLLGYYIEEDTEYLKVRDLERLGYSIKYRQELSKYNKEHIITISK